MGKRTLDRKVSSSERTTSSRRQLYTVLIESRCVDRTPTNRHKLRDLCWLDPFTPPTTNLRSNRSSSSLSVCRLSQPSSERHSSANSVLTSIAVEGVPYLVIIDFMVLHFVTVRCNSILVSLPDYLKIATSHKLPPVHLVGLGALYDKAITLVLETSKAFLYGQRNKANLRIVSDRMANTFALRSLSNFVTVLLFRAVISTAPISNVCNGIGIIPIHAFGAREVGDIVTVKGLLRVVLIVQDF
nr:hypothetical protein HmN_000881800 [Hymenolepis microstoma]